MSVALAPTYAIPGTGYSVQLRPLRTDEQTRASGWQRYAVALLQAHRDGGYCELATLGGLVVPARWADKTGSPELFEALRTFLLRDQAGWDALPREQRQNLDQSHCRWLASPSRVEAFARGMDRLVQARAGG